LASCYILGRGACPASHAPIDFPPMTNGDDLDDALLVIDAIEDAVLPDA
jgi:hypothetical protein